MSYFPGGRNCGDPELAAGRNRRALTTDDLTSLVDDAANYAGQSFRSSEDSAESAALSRNAADDSEASARISQEWAEASEDSATSASGSAAVAVGAKNSALGAADSASDSADDAAASALAAAGSEEGVEADRIAAENARTGAEDAKVASEGFRNEASDFRNTTLTARNQAQSYRDQALATNFGGTTVTAATDFNTILSPGVYGFTTTIATASANTPSNTAGVLRVHPIANGVMVQEYLTNSIRGTYARSGNGTNWSTWVFEAGSRVVSPAGQLGLEVYLNSESTLNAAQLAPVSQQLGTVDLNSVTLTGQYYQNNGGSATLARNYPVTSPGSLEVFQWGSGTFPIQRYTPFPNGTGNPVQGFYERGVRSGGIFGEWRFIAPQTIDKSAGLLISTWDDQANRPQMIYGDTGWRDASFLLDPALWQAVSGARQILVRREGQAVYLTARLVTVGDIPSGTKLVSLPAGWRGSGMTGPGTTPFSVGNVASPTSVGHVRSQPYLDSGLGTIDIRSAHTGPVEMSFSLSWMTLDAWPTSPLGTAVGTIPNA